MKNRKEKMMMTTDRSVPYGKPNKGNHRIAPMLMLGAGILVQSLSAATADVATLAELRAALTDTTRFPDGSTITLAATTFDIGHDADPTPLAVTRPLTLAGLNRTGTVISGGGLAKCLNITGADVVISNLTVSGGYQEATSGEIKGVGIYLDGARAKIVDVDVRNCAAKMVFPTTTSGGNIRGVGICNTKADAEIRNCRILDCAAWNVGGGDKEQVTVGAGIYSFDPSLRVVGTLISGCSTTNTSTRYSSYNISAVSGVNGGAGTYIGCAILSNVAWRTTAKQQVPDAAFSDATLVSNCLFRGNLSTRNGVITAYASFSIVPRIVDSSFIDNVSSNGVGSAIHIGNIKTYPVIERCLFEKNIGLRLDYDNESKARGGAICMDYVGGVVVSNCVFRGNEARNNGYGGAIGGRTGSDITVYGSVFEDNVAGGGGANIYNATSYSGSGAKVSVERCLFTGEAKATGGAIYADVTDSGHLTVRNSLFNQVGASGYCTCYGKSTGGAIQYEQCTMVGCPGTLFEFNNATSGSHASLAGCCLYGNGGEGLSRVSDITYSYLATDKAGAGNIVSSANPGFADYPKVLSIQKGSSLRDAGGAVESWMGDGSRKGIQDMGDGSYSFTPSAAVSIEGKAYPVGTRISFGQTNPRVANGKPDIGCFEYYAPGGMAVIIR